MNSKDAFYFPHFCNARHDRKIKRVRKELGIEGYGIFFMLLETLRDQADYKYPIEDLDLLADEFDTSEQKVKAVALSYGLFEVDSEKNFFSSKLIVFLQPYIETKNRNKISGIKGNLIRYGKLTKEEANSMTDKEILEFNESQKSLISGGESGGDRNKINKGDKVNKRNKVNIVIPSGVSELLSLKLKEFVKYRKEIKKPLKTSRPLTAMVNGIGTEYQNEDHLIQCIDYCMDHEWQGVKGSYVDYKTVASSSDQTEWEIFK